MDKNSTPWVGAAGTLLGFAGLSFRVPGWIGLQGGQAGVMIGGLVVFGLAMAYLVFLLLRKRTSRAPKKEGAPEIDHAFAAAEALLARSNAAAEKRIGRLPAAVILGPTGSAKSSIVTNSGLDPELLSGEVTRGNVTVPTEAANVWYAQGSVFVEAGGRLIDDPARWAHLVRRLQPRRLAAVFGRARQAPRLAILCFSCDEFLKPGASQNVQAIARKLRDRLAEASQQLGIQLPVYFLFTRADRLPGFADYVRSFSHDEAREVLGATLPISSGNAGTWAERESRRLNEAFAQITRALSLRRLEVLRRETEEGVRSGAYEFPRELSKLVEPAVQLLLDVFRPSQLGVSPFLRGFYFVGVRPIVVADNISDSARQVPTSSTLDMGATSVFNPAMLQQAMQQAAMTGAGGRKIPQWVFAHRFFRDVLLKDEVALGVTGRGTRVDALRRGLLVGATAACAALGALFTFSLFRSESLIERGAQAADLSQRLSAASGTISVDNLAALDSLRDQAARLLSESRGRVWVRPLYRGSEVSTRVRELYFQRFAPMIWNETRAALLSGIQQPDSSFSRTEAALAALLLTSDSAAALLTSSNPELSIPEELNRAATMFWPGRVGLSEDAQRVATRQFDFFATELPQGNPYPDTLRLDASLVEATRTFLLGFGNDAYYKVLLDAGKAKGQDHAFVDPQGLVRNPVVVSAAFTREGWREVDSKLESVDGLFDRRRWLYGDDTPPEKPSGADLRSRYYKDYVEAWQRYLAEGEVVEFRSIDQAVERLELLSLSRSTLFQMLQPAARNTSLGLDSTNAVEQAFRPLRRVVPSEETEALNVYALDYARALGALSLDLRRFANAPQPASPDEAITNVRSRAYDLTGSDGSEGVRAAESLLQLLRAPAEYAQNMVDNRPTVERNDLQATFCRSYGRVLGSLFPFNVRAERDASVDSVSAFFKPNAGRLWVHQQTNLANLIGRSGEPTGVQPVSGALTEFFVTSNGFAGALFAGDSLPRIVVLIQPKIHPPRTEVLLELGSQVWRMSSFRNLDAMTWRPGGEQTARLVLVQEDGTQTEIASGNGPWALFRLFASGAWTPGSDRPEVRWNRYDVTLAVDVASRGPSLAILNPGVFGRLSTCPASVTG